MPYTEQTTSKIYWAVLETVVDYPGIGTFEFLEMAGFRQRACQVASHWLRKHGLIEYDGWQGRHRATERGKIAIALKRGKEKRAQTRKLQLLRNNPHRPLAQP